MQRGPNRRQILVDPDRNAQPQPQPFAHQPRGADGVLDHHRPAAPRSPLTRQPSPGSNTVHNDYMMHRPFVPPISGMMHYPPHFRGASIIHRAPMGPHDYAGYPPPVTAGPHMIQHPPAQRDPYMMHHSPVTADARTMHRPSVSPGPYMMQPGPVQTFTHTLQPFPIASAAVNPQMVHRGPYEAPPPTHQPLRISSATPGPSTINLSSSTASVPRPELPDHSEWEQDRVVEDDNNNTTLPTATRSPSPDHDVPDSALNLYGPPSASTSLYTNTSPSAVASPPSRDRYFDAIVDRLRSDHECVHDEWRWVKGVHRCEECHHRLSSYIFECQQCMLQACNRCRRNRLR